tara:strand:+ start:104 stop:271 length:168 start_codon:yes stop_codon:yes gene_type:complete
MNSPLRELAPVPEQGLTQVLELAPVPERVLELAPVPERRLAQLQALRLHSPRRQR